MEVIWHIKSMQSSVCLPHVLLFPAMLLWPFIISSHHILSTASPASSYTFTELSLLLWEFHLHWEVASVIETFGYNLEEKLWQIINILSFKSEHFQCNFQLLLYFFSPQRWLTILLSVFIPHWTSPLKYISLANLERLERSVNKIMHFLSKGRFWQTYSSREQYDLSRNRVSKGRCYIALSRIFKSLAKIYPWATISTVKQMLKKYHPWYLLRFILNKGFYNSIQSGVNFQKLTPRSISPFHLLLMTLMCVIVAKRTKLGP